MEPVGGFEKSFSAQEKEAITKFLKYDQHVPLRIAEMVYSAETESEYFERAGTVLGGVASIAFFKFPIIRQLPIYWRVFSALIPGYYIFRWGVTTTEDLKWGKVHAAYQKFIVFHGLHPKIYF